MRKSLVTARWGLGAVFAAGFIMFGVASTVSGPLLPSIRLEYQLNLSQAGSLLSAQFIGFVLSVLVGGVVADTCGKRILVLAGAGVLTSGLVLVGCFYNRWLLTIGFFMTGIGFGGFDAGLSPLVGDLNPERKALPLNLLHTFFGVGALLGPLWAGAFRRQLGNLETRLPCDGCMLSHLSSRVRRLFYPETLRERGSSTYAHYVVAR